MSETNTSVQTDGEAPTEASGVDPNISENEVPTEAAKKFSQSEVDDVVKRRLAKEQKQHATERLALEKQIAEFKKAHKPADDDFKAKAKEWDEERQATSARLNKYREDSLRGKVERVLNDAGCLDSELAFADLKSKGAVGFDDNDEIVIGDGFAAETLDDLAKEYLARKPHLLKAAGNGGVGSKAPNALPTAQKSNFMGSKDFGVTSFKPQR